jgi:N-acyl-L-homoserine lactone synthetase
VTPTAEEARALADRLARQLVAQAVPVRFAPATSEAEKRAVYALRHRIVLEEGWVESDALPDGIEKDTYDDRALHLAGWDGSVLAATARLVFPSDGCRLPTEEAFAIDVRPWGRVVDLGRGLVTRPYRHRDHRTFLGLLATAWLESHARDFVRLCGATTTVLIERFRAMGFDVDVLGPSRLWWGEERFPILIDAERSAMTALERLGSPGTPSSLG